MSSSNAWKVGQTVDVQSRTWAGINKPGGCAKIVKVHKTTAPNGEETIEGVDVKYILGGGHEKQLDPSLVSAHTALERGGRSRRGRDFLKMDVDEERETKNKMAPPPSKRSATTKKALSSSEKENKRSKKRTKTSSTTANRKKPNSMQAMWSSKQNQQTTTHRKALTVATPQSPSATTPSIPVTPDQYKARASNQHHDPEDDPFSTSNNPKEKGRKNGKTSHTDCGSSASDSSTQVPAFIMLLDPDHASSVAVSPLALTDRRSTASDTKQSGNALRRSHGQQAKKKTVARRGLFGNSASNKRQKEPSQHDNPLAKAFAIQRQKNLEQKKLGQQVSTTKKDPKMKADDFKETQQSPSVPNNTVGVASNPNSKPVAKRRMMKAPPIAKSKEVLGVETAWEKVYEEGVKEAFDFMDQIKEARSQDIVGSSPNSPVNKGKEKEEGSIQEQKQPVAAAVDVRYQEFLSTFGTIRRLIDDGTIEEDDFYRLFMTQQDRNKKINSFSRGEIQKYLDVLCDNGKMMRSEGLLYIIDY